MVSTQALAFRNTKSSDFIEQILDLYRSEVKFLDHDRLLYEDIQNSINFIKQLDIDKEIL